MRIAEVIGSVEGVWTVPVVEIDCNKCARPVVASLKNKLLPFLEHVCHINCKYFISKKLTKSPTCIINRDLAYFQML